jgi:hypothetical protein
MPDVTGSVHEAPEPDAPVDVADTPREPTAYEKKLRTEARQHRLRAIEAERQRDEAIAAVRQESEQLVASLQSAASERVVRAELKAHAVKAGIVDLDGLRLVDLSGVKMTEAGEVEGAEALIASLKSAKPWLFGQSSSSSSAKPPPEQPMRPKNASEMTVDEWKSARRDIVRRR